MKLSAEIKLYKTRLRNLENTKHMLVMMDQRLVPELRKERESWGISLRQFAKRVGLSPSYYGKVERMEADVSPATMLRILQELEAICNG